MPYGNLKRIVQDYIPLTGLRAVLWHQGESEFYDTDPSAANYFNDLQTVIRQCRQDAGYDMAWVVARASMDNNLYANYGLTHYEPVVSAQNRVVQQVPSVFYGPDTDVIQMPRTDGVHFSGDGLIQLGDAWSDFLNDDFFRNTSPRLPQTVNVTDLRLALLVDQPASDLNRVVTVTVVATNEGSQPATNVLVQCMLPTGLSFVAGNESTYQRGVVFAKIGSVNPSESKQVRFQVSPQKDGTYMVAGEIIKANQIDIDSRANTSTGDGQDDMATVQFRAGSGPLYTVPVSINADPLPSVADNQPAPISDQADLSLAMIVDHAAVTVGSPVSMSLIVSNRGGLVSGRVQVGCQLPDGLTFLDGTGVQASGLTIRGTTVTIAPGSYDILSFRVVPTKVGPLIPHAQIESAGGIADPDSTPNNGYTNGEDDCAQVSLRAN
jgi:uncharacterized repeat protein (TIGR01451 family)